MRDQQQPNTKVNQDNIESGLKLIACSHVRWRTLMNLLREFERRVRGKTELPPRWNERRANLILEIHEVASIVYGTMGLMYQDINETLVRDQHVLERDFGPIVIGDTQFGYLAERRTFFVQPVAETVERELAYLCGLPWGICTFIIAMVESLMHEETGIDFLDAVNTSLFSKMTIGGSGKSGGEEGEKKKKETRADRDFALWVCCDSPEWAAAFLSHLADYINNIRKLPDSVRILQITPRRHLLTSEMMLPHSLGGSGDVPRDVSFSRELMEAVGRVLVGAKSIITLRFTGRIEFHDYSLRLPIFVLAARRGNERDPPLTVDLRGCPLLVDKRE